MIIHMILVNVFVEPPLPQKVAVVDGRIQDSAFNNEPANSNGPLKALQKRASDEKIALHFRSFPVCVCNHCWSWKSRESWTRVET